MEPFTDRTLNSVDALRFELAGTHRSGVARDREGSVLGVCCHAAPIIEAGRPAAAISISVPVAMEEASRRALRRDRPCRCHQDLP